MKWATAAYSQLVRCRTLRALGFLRLLFLGFRFASPQAVCFHPLRGLAPASSDSLAAYR